MHSLVIIRRKLYESNREIEKKKMEKYNYLCIVTKNLVYFLDKNVGEKKKTFPLIFFIFWFVKTKPLRNVHIRWWRFTSPSEKNWRRNRIDEGDRMRVGEKSLISYICYTISLVQGLRNNKIQCKISTYFKDKKLWFL